MSAKEYKPYPKYRETGIEWLGKIPAHWDKYRIKTLISSYFNGVWGNEEKYNGNDVACIRVSNFDRGNLSVSLDNITIRNISEVDLKSKVLQENDLLIEKSGGGETTLVGAIVRFNTTQKCVCSNFISCIRLKSNVSSQYMNYYFNSLYSKKINYIAIKQTTGIQNIDVGIYFNNNVFLPPISEQEEIAAFLDSKIGKIDALVAKLEMQLKLIDEQRSSLITQTVCKGLNPNIKFKETGIEWLGKIPAHWEVKKLKYLLHNYVNKCNVGSLPLVDLENILSNDGKLLVNLDKLSFIDYNTDKLIFNENNILYGKLRPYLKKVWISSFKGYCSPEFLVLIPYRNIPKFFYYWFMSNIINFISNSTSYGSKMPRASWDFIGDHKVSFPPISEQEEIVKYLDNKLLKIDELKQKTIKQIEVLKEYKTSLITSVVTGKIDVRDEFV